MKSYFLEHIESLGGAEAALRKWLPGQESPWVLLSPRGDPVAYFNIQRDLDGTQSLNIQADISGRHSNELASVIAVLKEIQGLVGGVISDDAEPPKIL